MSALTETSRGKNFVIYKDGKGVEFIKIEKVRLSYPFIGTPSDDEDDNGNKSTSYRITAMLPKETHLEAKNALKAMIERILKANEAKVPVDKWCLSNGDDKESEEMAGHWLVSASDKNRRPTARDQKGQVIDDIAKIDDKFYGGCWGNVLVRPWYFNGKSAKSTKTYPKRISCGLQAVQFYKDDTPFGQGRVDDSDVWGATDDADEGDDGMGGDDDI